MALIGKNAIPFILGLAVGVVFNEQIRQGWGMLQSAVPQIPDIPSFGGGGGVEEPIEEPVEDNPAAANYAYKADFDREYESNNQTHNNGIPFY